MTAEEPVFEVFAELKSDLGIAADRIGFEQAEAFEPAGYAPNLFRGSAARLLRRAFPSATLAPADELLAQMRTIKTVAEIQHIRTACARCGAGVSPRLTSFAHWLDGGSDSGSVSSSAEFVSGGIRKRESLRRLYVLHVRAELGQRLWPLFPFTHPKN